MHAGEYRSGADLRLLRVMLRVLRCLNGPRTSSMYGAEAVVFVSQAVPKSLRCVLGSATMLSSKRHAAIGQGIISLTMEKNGIYQELL